MHASFSLANNFGRCFIVFQSSNIRWLSIAYLGALLGAKKASGSVQDCVQEASKAVSLHPEEKSDMDEDPLTTEGLVPHYGSGDAAAVEGLLVSYESVDTVPQEPSRKKSSDQVVQQWEAIAVISANTTQQLQFISTLRGTTSLLTWALLQLNLVCVPYIVGVVVVGRIWR